IGLAADSLLANRGRHAGYFLVRRLMRRGRPFGFPLGTPDIIQHARAHDQVIAQGLDLKAWPELPAQERLRQLRELLGRDQGPAAPFDAMGRRSLWVFQAIAQARHKFGGRAIGEYIVSGARGPEDILAVLLLARWADITDKRTASVRSMWRRCSSRSIPWKRRAGFWALCMPSPPIIATSSRAPIAKWAGSDI